MKPALEGLARGAGLILLRPLSDHERDLFVKYLELLVKWQRSQRLVGSSDPAWIVDHLFLDSLLFLRVLPDRASTIADVGSGAGLPGVPLAIVRSDLRIALIESRSRRVSFLSAVIRELPLPNAGVLSGRVEDVAQGIERQFDAVVMRCAGDFADVAAAAVRLVRPGGTIIASGPPTSSPSRLAVGRFVDVPGVDPGSLRRFAVYQA
jgi:16S rRNA (guanine527-N7)-methyltransferase